MLVADPTQLDTRWQIAYVLAAFLIVAFGQPAWVPAAGLVAACIGYAIFWRVMFCWEGRLFRFTAATLWFACAELIHLSWMTADDYQGKYVYGLLVVVSLCTGAQFGLLSLLVRRKTLASLGKCAALCSIWVLMEWSRLFVLTGFSWNPVGLSLTGWVVPLQLATIGGVYGLSFVVIFTNLCALRVWALSDQIRPIYIWGAVAIIPYIFGFAHMQSHSAIAAQSEQKSVRALLIQPAEPPYVLAINAKKPPIQHAYDTWREVLELAERHYESNPDIVVLPETIVPYDAHRPVYPIGAVRAAFRQVFGESSLSALPELAGYSATINGSDWLVSNAYWAQALANLFQADVVAGLEDSDEHSYNAALLFRPEQVETDRYEKRVLVPMGEFIPYEWARDIARTYGITQSFTPGATAKVFQSDRTPPFGISICYEETYGDLMRESRQLGAEMLVNVTNDGWFPDSRLPQQHFDHARLRSVENGVPLLRACNTGITGAVDSLGRIVGVLGKDPVTSECAKNSIVLDVPTYHYSTIYSLFGDGAIVGLSFIFAGLALRFRSLSL